MARLNIALVRDGSVHYLSVEWCDSTECGVEIMPDIAPEEAEDPVAQGMAELVASDVEATRRHAFDSSCFCDVVQCVRQMNRSSTAASLGVS